MSPRPSRVVLSRILGAMLLWIGGCSGTGQLTATPVDGPRGGPARHGAQPGAGSEIAEESTGFSLRIERPEAGAMLGRSPVRVEGAATGVTAVVVAGIEAPVIDGRFRADLPLPDGAHIISAQAAGRQVEVSFGVDASGPRFEILEPARGLFHDVEASGPSITVRGSVTDIGSGVASLTLNGRPVTFDDKGAFSASFTPSPGLSTLELVALDGAGHTSSTLRSVISGRFAPAGGEVERALDVKLGRAGLDAIIEQAREALASTPLEDLVPMGGDGGEFEVTSFQYSGTDVDLVPDYGGFRISVRIRGLRVGVRVRKKVLFVPVTFTGSVSAQEAELQAFLSVTATAAGSVDMAISEAYVQLHGFDYDIDGLPGFLEGLLSGFVRGFAEGALEDALQGVVLPSLFDPADLVQTLDLMGTPLTLGMRLSLLTVSPEGLRFQAAVRAGGPPAPPHARERAQAPGALRGLIPDTARGSGGPEGPLQVAISADAVNQVLHAAWAAGGLDLSVDLGGAGGSLPIQLDVAGIGAALGVPLDQAAPGDSPIVLSLQPMLPPVLTPAPAGDGELAGTLRLGDMLFHLDAQPAGQDAIRLLSVALSIDADLRAGDPADDQGLGGIRVKADLISSAVPAQDESVEQGVASLLTLAAPLLGGVLDNANAGDAAAADPERLTLLDALFGSNGKALVIAGDLGPAR